MPPCSSKLTPKLYQALALSFGLILLTSCNGLFYQPDNLVYSDPKSGEVPFDEFFIPSSDQVKLHAWLFTPQSDDKNTLIVQLHGNAQNMTSHALYTYWLATKGYHVMTFDYRGYGRSSGEPSRDGLLDDATEVFRYIKQHPKLQHLKLVVIGQSLGGAIAIPALVKAQLTPILVVLDSTFGSYQEVARSMLANNTLSWPFQWLAYLLVTDDHAPLDSIGKLHTAFLFIHSTKDPVVAYSNSIELYAKASNPKALWPLETRDHIGALAPYSGLQDKFLEFLEEQLKGG